MSIETTQLLTTIDPFKLKTHPISQEVYGDVADDELIESLKEVGQLTPIVLASDGETVISGHRRMQAGRILCLETMRVIIRRDLSDADEIALAVIHANASREKTPEQRAREYQYLKEIKARMARRRQSHEVPATEESDSKHDGESGVQAAAEVGWSVTTAERAAEVVDEIDASEATGDTERAAELRQKLNNGSVSAAHRAATDTKQEDKPGKRLRSLAKTIEKVRVDIDAVVIERGSSEFTSPIMGHLDKALISMKKWASALDSKVKSNGRD